MMRKLSLRWRLTILISCLFLVMCTAQMLVNNFWTAQQTKNIIHSIQPPEDSTIVKAEIITIDQYQAITDQTFLKNWGTLLVILFLGAVFTYLLVGYCLKPLHQLSEHIQKTNANNLGHPSEVTAAADEVAQLTKAYDDLSYRLSEAFSSQQRFLSDAAHELRTPLTVLQTKLDVFSKQGHTVQEYQELLTAVRRQTTRLTALSNQLLDLTKERTLVYESFLLRDLTEEVQCDLAGAAADRQIMLHDHIPADFIVETDYVLLYRIVFNLVENGIKYNQTGGAVSLQASRTAKHWTVVISDTGCGIPPEVQESIFLPFWRVDDSRSREMGGAGLGLAIVKELTARLGGTVQITANTPAGTRFAVTFPIRTEHAANEKCD